MCICVPLQGSLRDALDCKLLSKAGSYMAPSVVLTLAHDIAAAMLHLHRYVLVRVLRRMAGRLCWCQGTIKLCAACMCTAILLVVSSN